MRKLTNCGGLLPIFPMNRPSLRERPVFPHLQLQALTHNQFQKNTKERVRRQGFSNRLKNAVLLDSEQDRGKSILRTGDTLSVCASPATWATGSGKIEMRLLSLTGSHLSHREDGNLCTAPPGFSRANLRVPCC